MLQLPPKTEELVPVTLSPRERAFYLEAYRAARARYDVMRRHGVAGSAFLDIMSYLLPMRKVGRGCSELQGGL